MRRVVVPLLVLIFFATGCTGSFILTKKVYDFHRQQEEKWMDELIFLGCAIFPVYSLATLGDAIIFNVIEFWTEENPLEESESAKIKKGDLEVVLTRSGDGDSVHLSALKALQPQGTLTLERTEFGVIAKDADGDIIYISQTDQQGGIGIYDADMNLVQYVSPDEIKTQRQKLLN